MENRIGEQSKFWEYCNLSNVRTKPSENDWVIKKNQVVQHAEGDDNRKVGWELVMESLGVMLKNLDFNFQAVGSHHLRLEEEKVYLERKQRLEYDVIETRGK